MASPNDIALLRLLLAAQGGAKPRKSRVGGRVTRRRGGVLSIEDDPERLRPFREKDDVNYKKFKQLLNTLDNSYLNENLSFSEYLGSFVDAVNEFSRKL